MTKTQSWPQVLDDLEQRIMLTEAALDADDILNEALTRPFEAPQGLGPLPTELQERAREILKRQAETQQRIVTVFEEVRGDVAKATRQRGASEKASKFSEGPAPRFFDSNI